MGVCARAPLRARPGGMHAAEPLPRRSNHAFPPHAWRGWTDSRGGACLSPSPHEGGTKPAPRRAALAPSSFSLSRLSPDLGQHGRPAPARPEDGTGPTLGGLRQEGVRHGGGKRETERERRFLILFTALWKTSTPAFLSHAAPLARPIAGSLTQREEEIVHTLLPLATMNFAKILAGAWGQREGERTRAADGGRRAVRTNASSFLACAQGCLPCSGRAPDLRGCGGRHVACLPGGRPGAPGRARRPRPRTKKEDAVAAPTPTPRAPLHPPRPLSRPTSLSYLPHKQPTPRATPCGPSTTSPPTPSQVHREGERETEREGG